MLKQDNDGQMEQDYDRSQLRTLVNFEDTDSEFTFDQERAQVTETDEIDNKILPHERLVEGVKYRSAATEIEVSQP